MVDWRKQERLERALTGRSSAQRAARLLLIDEGALGEAEDAVAVDVPEEDYELWLAAQLVWAVQGEPPTDPRPRTLRAKFKQDAQAASDAYWRVERKLEAASKRNRKPAYPRKREAELAEQLLPRRMTHPQIVEYSARRAVEFGFSPWAIWAKSQGTRSRATEAEREARARIVVGLRDRGATLADIGGVFSGRTKESVLALERAGRKSMGGRRDNGPAPTRKR